MRITIDIPLPLSEIATAASGITLVKSDKVISCVSTDSRKTEKNDLFIALKGKNQDGHDYIELAKEKGAITLGNSKSADIIVNDSEEAFLRIASYYKSKLSKLKHTVAITGSVGKTTVKEFLRAIISSSHITHANFDNYNNVLGLAHTLLSAPRDTEVLIAELGMNHEGEISLLSKALKPDVAIITNVGTAHIGNLGSREMISKAKLEINDGMTDGITIVPHEEPLLSGAQGRFTVSLSTPLANAFMIPLFEGVDRTSFDFYTKKLIITAANVNISGRHNINDLAFALSAASVMDLDRKSISLDSVTPSLLRRKWLKIGTNLILDDTYSASPEAVVATLTEATKKKGERFAVLGDMLELGASCESEHYKIGKAAVELGYSRLFLFGVYSVFTARGAIDAGMKKENVHVNTDTTSPEITADQIRSHAKGAVIVVKGSHVLHTERIIKLLQS